MRDNEILLYAGLAIAGVVILNRGINIFKPKNVTLDRDQLAAAVHNAGGTVQTTNLGTFYKVKGGVMKLDAGAELRPWEAALIGVDRFVPGSYLTRFALS